MTIYDISLSISETLPVWPGDPPVRITHSSHLDVGDEATVSRLDFGAHTGTHVDAPAHFVAGGKGVDRLDLDLLVGAALVVHVLEASALSADLLESLDIPPATERVLFRTRNSELWARPSDKFDEDFVAITEDGARWLVARGLRLVGVDYLSVAPFHDSVPTHQILLRAGLIVVEGLDLGQVASGRYQFICLPLKLANGDGAPARAILLDE
jgi:arylformamidase